MARKGNALPAEWTTWSPPDESLFPRQRNGYDCGVFTCMYAAWASITDSHIDFSQSDMPLLRRWLTHAISEQYLGEMQHNGGCRMPKHTDTRPDQTQRGQRDKGQNMSGRRVLGEKRSTLLTERQKLENLSLDRFLDDIRGVDTGQDKMQVEQTAVLLTGLEPTGGQGALGDTVISRSQPGDGTDPDDIPPVSAKMSAARSRENKARRAVVLDSGDEEDDSRERAGCGYHTVEQKQVRTSRIVKPPKVRSQSRRRAPTRQGQDFEDQTCDLLRKAEEETVISRLELEEYLRGGSSMVASGVLKGNVSPQAGSRRRNMAQVRQLRHCLSRWGMEELTDDQVQCYSDLGSTWMSNRLKP